MKKRCLKTMCYLFLIISLVFGGKVDVSAGTINSPTEISIGQTVTGIFTDDKLEECYSINLNKAGRLSIDFTNDGVIGVTILDLNGNVLYSDAYSPTVVWYDTRTITLDLTKGVYKVYLSASGTVSKYGDSYSLVTSFIGAKESYDSNSDFSSAVNVYPGQKIYGHLAINSNAKYYKVKLNKKGNLVINAKTNQTYGFVNVYDKNLNLVEDGELILRNTDKNGQGTLSLNLKKGTYYIEVISEKDFYANNKYGTFSFSFKCPSSIIVQKNIKYIINANKTASVKSLIRDVSTVNIPAYIKYNGKKYDVVKIENGAFANNMILEKISLGKNIRIIGKKAFYKASNLHLITIKSKQLTTKSVGKNALKGTSEKLVIKVPSKMISKYKKVFKGKGNEKVIIKK